MERFYGNLLQHDRRIDEALREAQVFVRTLTVRDIMTRYAGGPDGDALAGLDWLIGLDGASCPFVNEAFWGGFICMGTMRPFSSRTGRRRS
jgi:hypothetical protein